MTTTERDISRFLAEMHGKLDAVEAERRDLAQRVRSGSAGTGPGTDLGA